MTEQTLELAELSPDEIREIYAEMAHYAEKTAVAIDALKIVQQHRGWVSDVMLIAVAKLLEISPAQLEAVATFYNLIYRQPVGKTVIHYCDSVSCWMLGAEQVCERLCRHLNVGLGEITADGSYTILPIPCLGACDHAPVVMVGQDLKLDVHEQNAVAFVLGEAT